MLNHYDMLKTAPGADDATIKKAYRKFALTHHPDKTLHLPDAERKKREHAFKLATTAYEVPSDTGKRTAYDRTLGSTRFAPTATYTSTAAQQQQQFARQQYQAKQREQEKQQQQAREQAEAEQYRQDKRKRPSQKSHTKPGHQPADSAWSEKYWEERMGKQRAHPPERPSWGDGYSERAQQAKRKYAQPGHQWSGAVPSSSAPPPSSRSEPQPQRDYQYWQAPTSPPSSAQPGPVPPTHPFPPKHHRTFHFYQAPIPPPPAASDFSYTHTTSVFGGPTLFVRAPVSSNSTHTKIYFSNHQGWDFSIAAFKKFKLVERPVLPPIEGGTNGEISIKLRLQRDRSALSFPFLKELLLDIKNTPNARQIAVSCMFVEKSEGIEMRILLGSMLNVPMTPGWTWAFDADCGHMLGLGRSYRVSHVMYWPQYSGHAMVDGGMPVQEPCPAGSPLGALKNESRDIVIHEITKSEHCKEEMWAGKKLWRLLAVGHVPV